MRAPVHCRSAAYQLFADQVRDLDAPGALVRASVAIAMHELHDVDPALVEHELDVIARQVRARVTSDHPEAYLAHLHHVLFDELGFCGAVEDYYDPANSYLPRVLQRRRGLPITLTLVYKEVGERVGLTIAGINAPGHFLARVDGMLVDPFACGRVLTRDEAFDRLEEILGPDLPRNDELLPPATARLWLDRMIRNLLNLFASRSQSDDVAAMRELRDLL